MRLPSKGSASPHNLCQPVGDTAYKGPVLADIGKNTITLPPPTLQHSQVQGMHMYIHANLSSETVVRIGCIRTRQRK